MRKRKVNPCWLKGKYGGKRANGRKYPHSIVISGCECRNAFPSIRPLDFPPLTYLMNTTPGEHAGLTVKGQPQPNSGENTKNFLCTVPCEEIFRHRTSKGTRLYRKLFPEKTQFKGCQPLEEDLVEDKEVRHEIKEIVGLPQAADNASDGDEEEYNVPDSSGVLSTTASLARFFLKLAISETSLFRDKPVRPNAPALEQGELNIAPNDLKHRHLIHLYESGAFEDKNLNLVAALSIEGISDAKVVSNVAPHLTRAEFVRQQGKVYRMVEETLPDKTKKFLKLWKTGLSEKQREAVNLVYMNNDEKLSKTEVAEKLNISRDSLEDRLDAVIPKLKGLFLEGNQPKPRQKINGLYKIPDAQESGFFYRSEAKKVHALIHIDPKTGTRVTRDLLNNPLPPRKQREGVNVMKIRAWARGY